MCFVGTRHGRVRREKTKTPETTETVANRESQQAEETKEAEETKLETPEQLPVSLVVRNSGRELVNLEPNGMGIEEKHHSYPDWTEVPRLPDAASEGLHEAMKRYEEEQTAALKNLRRHIGTTANRITL